MAASPVARPVCQLPPGCSQGTSETAHTGHGYKPVLILRLGKRQLPAGIAAEANEFGQGHGNRTAPTRPMTVPVTVSDSGIDCLSISQKQATRRKENRMAWKPKTTQPCPGGNP